MRLTLFVSLACVLACAQGPEGSVGLGVFDPNEALDRPPEVIRLLDAGASPDGELADDGEGGYALPLDDELEASDAGGPLESTLSPQRDALDAGAGLVGLVDASTDTQTGAPNALGSVCRPGTYAGVFAGEIRALLGIVRVTISGTLRFELPAATSGNLVLQNGTLDGKDSDGHPLKARVSGTLNCATGELEGGRLTNGTYTRPDPVLRGRTTTAQFTGVTSGVMRGDPPAAQGSWAVDNERNTRTGSGSWSAQLVP